MTKITVIELLLIVGIVSILAASFQLLVIVLMAMVLLATPAVALWFIIEGIKEKVHAWFGRNR